jgi:hypothetical protein
MRSIITMPALFLAAMTAAQGAQPPGGQSSLPPSVAAAEARLPDDPDQRTSYMAMFRFVYVNASIAGSDSACERDAPLALRQCTLLSLQNWDTATGMARLRDDKLLRESSESIWVETYDRARAVQSGPDATASCAAVEARIRSVPVMQNCGNRLLHPGPAGQGADLPPIHVD